MYIGSIRKRPLIFAGAMFATALAGWRITHLADIHADSSYHNLAASNLTQNWSNIGLITADDNWGGVPSITGYRGDDLTTATGADPQTLTGTSTVVDVDANRADPNAFATGGVAEFHLSDPAIALQGSGTADAPHIQLYLNATSRQSITVAYRVRDLDTNADNAVQQVALQFRSSPSANWTNVPGAYIADATAGPNVAGPDSNILATLPAEANNGAQLEVRIITTNAGGSDEWVGIDDIAVSSAPCDGPCPVPPPPTLTPISQIQGEGRISAQAQ